MKGSRRIAAILAADVVGYSRLVGADVEGSLAALGIRRAIFARLVAEFSGREFGCVGDSLMAHFGSALDAVRSARRIQHAVAEENETVAAERHMTLRIGIDLGEVVEENGLLYGDGVNIAARLQAMAAPGGIIASGAVHEQVKNRLSVTFKALGTQQVKNVARPIACFEILEAVPAPRERRAWRWLRRQVTTGKRRAMLALAALLVLGAAGAWYWRYEHAGAVPEPAAVSAAFPDKSIAVLPFADMSAEQDQGYMSDGIAEELLNLLAKVPDLKVIARTSSFAFKRQNLDVAEIARRLNVAHVVEGSVRRSGDRLRITAQLIRARDHTQLWSQHYDRPQGDIFMVQDEIAGAIVRALQLRMMGGTLTRGDGEVRNLEAYTLSLQAREISFQYTSAALEQSIALYQRALTLDPDYAKAWVGLAGIYCYQVNESLRDADEGMRLARAATEKALALDPRDALAYARQAWIAIYYDLDYATAARRLEQALALDATNIEVINLSAILLRRLGRMEQAVELGEYLVARDPVNPESHENLALALAYAGRWESALKAYDTLLILSPQFIGGHGRRGLVLLLMGDAESALRETELETDERWRLHQESLAHQALGQFAAAESALKEFTAKYGESLAVAVAQAEAMRGDKDAAFEWLEVAARNRDPSLGAVPFHPLFVNLHDDPRWSQFLRRQIMAPEQLAAIKFDVTLPAK